MPDDNSKLHHEDLDAYRAAIEFLTVAALVAFCRQYYGRK